MRLVVASKPVEDFVRRRNNIAASKAFPAFKPTPGTTGPVAICAAGPSLLKSLPILKALAASGMPVCSVKGVDAVLREHGIVSTYAIFLDSRADQVRFMATSHPDTLYCLASQVDPALYAALQERGHRIATFNASSPELHDHGDDYITGGSTTGLRAISLMQWAGYDSLHLFGFDCSFDDTSHVYDKPNQTPPLKVTVGTRAFTTTAELACQHQDFIRQIILATNRPKVMVHGDSALAETTRLIAADSADVWMEVDLIPDGGERLEGKEAHDNFLSGKPRTPKVIPGKFADDPEPEKLGSFFGDEPPKRRYPTLTPQQLNERTAARAKAAKEATNAPDRISVSDYFHGRRGVAVPTEQIEAHVMHALTRKWPEHGWVRPHTGVFVICCGGPSIKDRKTLDEIRRLNAKGGHFICTVNGSHDHFLDLPRQKLGPKIESDFAVLLDPKTRVKDYMHPVGGTLYFIASQCDPHVLDVFDKPGIAKFLYHHEDSVVTKHIGKDNHAVPPMFSTVGLQSILIGYRLGFRTFRIFAMEGSYKTEIKDGKLAPTDLHGYHKEKEYRDVVQAVARNPLTGEEEKFLTNAHMACQAEDLRSFTPYWDRQVKKAKYERITLIFHGEGYVPTAARFLNSEFPWVTHDDIHSRLRHKCRQHQPLAGQGNVPAGVLPGLGADGRREWPKGRGPLPYYRQG